MLRANTMKEQTVGVLGLGLSGRAALTALATAGAKTFAYDDVVSTSDLPDITLCDWRRWPWDRLDALVISPGIPHHFPKPHPAAAMAIRHGIEIISEVELALRAKPKARLIAVSGTNGKSTTTALIGHCLKEAGIAVSVGGNIGTPACALDDPGEDGFIVLEISSYQLETTPSLAADVAVLLNISPDHLDRHGGMEGYIAAKARLIDQMKPSGIAITGTADAHIRRLSAQFRQKGTRVITVTAEDAPQALQQSVSLAGAHNAENAAAAAATLLHFGIDKTEIDRAIRSFQSLPHRLQPVADCGKIRFVNDSKATNGVAAAKALGAFRDIYWIAGGLAKEDGLQPVMPWLSAVKKAYLIGSAANQFAASLKDICPAAICGDLDTATRTAFQDASAAAEGGTILLAPAAASFDQFKNFGVRGEAFADLARELCATVRGHEHA